MTHTANQASAPIDSHDIDDHATDLIGILCSVMHQCDLDDHDFDLLLSLASRRYINDLIHEQAEERSVS